MYSEIIWVLLYSYTILSGIFNDDLTLTTTSFFLLALAGLEFCIGFIIIIYFKNFKKSFDLDFFITKNQNKKINLNNVNLF